MTYFWRQSLKEVKNSTIPYQEQIKDIKYKLHEKLGYIFHIAQRLLALRSSLVQKYSDDRHHNFKVSYKQINNKEQLSLTRTIYEKECWR